MGRCSPFFVASKIAPGHTSRKDHLQKYIFNANNGISAGKTRASEKIVNKNIQKMGDRNNIISILYTRRMRVGALFLLVLS